MSLHPDLAQALLLGTSTLYEASGLNCAIDPAIRAVWPGARVAAPAYPVRCSPGDNLAIHLALEQAPRGSVLVVGTQDFVAGYWGEVLTVAAEVAGLRGLVIDGGVRDVAALQRRQFPVFSRGVAIKGTIKASAPQVGRPILMSGVPVNPGDWVVADEDGVVVLPLAEAERVLRAAQARAEKEAMMMAQLQRGVTTVELMGLQAWRASP
jgi:4-hydroxy-4-methyl-2-oxoglutarate aldolase